MQHVMNAGFPADADMVHLFIGGSQLHGAKVVGYDDLDIYGAYIEPPKRIHRSVARDAIGRQAD